MHALRIMCVEHEGSASSRLRGELENAGYETVAAASVAEALQLLKSEPVDAIIVECRPSDCSCASATAEFTHLRPELPVLMISDVAELAGVPLSYLREFLRKRGSPESLMASLAN